MVATDWLVYVGVWLILIGILGILASVSKGALVLRRRSLWGYMETEYGAHFTQRFFLIFSLLCMIIGIILIFSLRYIPK